MEFFTLYNSLQIYLYNSKYEFILFLIYNIYLKNLRNFFLICVMSILLNEINNKYDDEKKNEIFLYDTIFIDFSGKYIKIILW